MQTTQQRTMMRYLLLLATIRHAVHGGRSWTLFVKPTIDVDEYETTQMRKNSQERDPFLTRSTVRPTLSPTITGQPTSSPTYSFPTHQPSVAPTTLPTMAISEHPTQSQSPSVSQAPSISHYPSQSIAPSTGFPTWKPGSGPTPAPTERQMDQTGNGGCRGYEVLHQVTLYDKWGDGWDGRDLILTRLGDVLEKTEVKLVDAHQYLITRSVTDLEGFTTVSVTKFSNLTYPPMSDTVIESVDYNKSHELSANPVFIEGLDIGKAKYGYTCLKPNRCYQASLSGGLWSDEISWEIRYAPLGMATNALGELPPIVDGGAPSNCTFSVPEDYMNEATWTNPPCSTTCHKRDDEPIIWYRGASAFGSESSGKVYSGESWPEFNSLHEQPSASPSSIPSSSPFPSTPPEEPVVSSGDLQLIKEIINSLEEEADLVESSHEAAQNGRGATLPPVTQEQILDTQLASQNQVLTHIGDGGGSGGDPENTTHNREDATRDR